MRRQVQTIRMLGSIALFAIPCILNAASPLSRAEFAKKMASIPDGTPQREVAERIGQPDSRRRGEAFEVWNYGENGEGTLPTLGYIVFDGHSRVKKVIGRVSETPPPGMFDEHELRRLLSFLHQPLVSLKANYPTFEPRRMIAMANVIQPLGKNRILALTNEYLRITSPYDEGRVSIGLVLLMLFDVPEKPGFLPPLVILPYWPKPPEDRRHSPRYPIAMIDDVPILLVRRVNAFSSGGAGLNWAGLDGLREDKYRLRKTLLMPEPDPFVIPAVLKQRQPWFFAAFEVPGNWERRPPPSGEEAVGRQVLSLVDSVLARPMGSDEWPEGKFEQRWRAWRSEFLDYRAKWDQNRGMYVSEREGSGGKKE